MPNENSPLVLGTEKISKLLLHYAIPAIIAMTSASLYNIIDSIFIGHGVGPLGISGLAIALPLMNLASAFGSMVGIGASSLMSIKLGQNDMKSAHSILGNVVLLNTIVGLSFTAVTLTFLDPILYFFGASEVTIPYARDFMRIILAGNVVTHIYLGLNDMLRASGYPTKAMFVMLTAVVCNCIFNPLLIFGFGWGIQGSATATVIAQTVAMSIELHHFSCRKSFIHFQRSIFRLKAKIVRGILSIGLAPFLLNVCASIVVIFINNALKNNGGDLYIGAYGIVNRVVLLFVMVVAGLNLGMQPIVGYNYGARKYDRVKRTLRQGILVATCVTTAGFLLSHIFPVQISMLFTTNEELLAVAEQGLKVVTIVFPLVGFQIVTSSFFQSIGKAQKAIFLSLTRQMLFLIPLLAILPSHLGSFGVWVSMPIADTMAVILAAVLLTRQMKKFREEEALQL